MTARSPDDSASGRLNAFTHRCMVTEQTMSYAACLNRLAVLAAEPDVTVWTDCQTASGYRSCPAQKMRDEELARGQAIYFVERKAVETFLNKTREWASEVLAGCKKPKKAKKERGDSLFDAIGELGATGYAGAVNKRLEQPSLSAPKVEVRPGETPLQAARRIMLERQKGTSQE